ncbi:MAG: carboxypeptidase regulatory-like domain-containing protein [Bacteroidota bacterium]|nr:carboxypeptidase regulatory-like domain-containing protein [Bacteroidota bacterium]MDP4232783.1 carboxypeptidase regulatory-like domain-containing protein [Bacteroidota bacterium]MDP4242535.1 carboxypeptidase regulatory-like domain-containing protein [Bacteroidota bacterium]MDP4288886.1 carboxypeptidase regulatory-like domain-containing protein [Bacteroidota bacterium]
MRHRILLFGALAIVGLCTARTAEAQYGKISAKLVDAKTGEPLLHASVQVLETKQGAYSKENGVATIINLPPSENYTVVAKYAGYVPDTAYHVKVQSDITTSLNFKLGSKNVTIIVTSDKQVDKTKTDISTKFAPSVLMSMPSRQRLDQVILLTPGLVQDNSNGGFSVHGSRGTQNAIKINNVEISDPLTGRTSTLQQSISRLAISEVDVVTGNADASKGGFTGGMVNTQTKQGTNTLDVSAHYRTEIPALFGTSSNGFKQMPAGDNLYEVSVSGPLVTDAVKYAVTAKLNSFKYYNVFTDPTLVNDGLGVTDPLGNNVGQLPHDSRWRRYGSAKLTFDAFGFNMSADAELSSETDLINDASFLYLDPYYLPASNTVNNVYDFNARGQIGDGVLELTGAYSIINSQTGKYDQSQPVDALHSPKFMSIADNYTWNDQDQSVIKGGDGIIDIFTQVSQQIPNPANPTQPYGNSVPGVNPFTGHIEGPPITYTTNNAYGLPGIFPTVGNVYGISQENTGQSQFKGQYSVQIGSHYLSGGVEGNYMSLFQYSNGLPWDANPFKDSFYVHPYTGAINVSDKMEFSDITFNPGLRFDMYQPGTKTINNIYDPIGTGTTATPLQTQLSPRLAITYAVTDQTTFDFGYNWYFKQPNLYSALQNAAGNDALLRLALLRGNNLIGNGGLKAERTREVGVGFSTQVSDVVSLSIHGIYKDLRNDAGLQRISSPLLATGYLLYSDDQYGNSRAIEVILEKRMSDNYSVKLQYTYSSAKGTSTSATENYAQLINADPNSEQAVLPLQPFPLSFDKPHVAQLIFNLNYNKGEGPTLFGSKLLEEFSLAATTEYQSGVPYTRYDLRGAQIGDFNGDREPDYFQTDATLTRTIPFEDLLGPSFKSLSMDLQLEISNVFNRTTPLEVFPTTGQGDNDGSLGVWGSTIDYVNDPVNGPFDQFGKPLYNARIAQHDKIGNVSDVVTVADQQASFTRLRNDNLSRHLFYQIPRRAYFNVIVRF